MTSSHVQAQIVRISSSLMSEAAEDILQAALQSQDEVVRNAAAQIVTSQNRQKPYWAITNMDVSQQSLFDEFFRREQYSINGGDHTVLHFPTFDLTGAITKGCLPIPHFERNQCAVQGRQLIKAIG